MGKACALNSVQLSSETFVQYKFFLGRRGTCTVADLSPCVTFFRLCRWSYHFILLMTFGYSKNLFHLIHRIFVCFKNVIVKEPARFGTKVAEDYTFILRWKSVESDKPWALALIWCELSLLSLPSPSSPPFTDRISAPSAPFLPARSIPLKFASNTVQQYRLPPLLLPYYTFTILFLLPATVIAFLSPMTFSRGQIKSPWLGDKVDSGIALHMVNVLEKGT
jgi:hypothetical protein